MNKKDLKPGTKVIASINDDDDDDDEYSNYEVIAYVYDKYKDSTLIGTILDKQSITGKVWVKWEEGEYNDEEQEVNIKLLSLESDLNILEQEFEAAKKLVKDKMKEAAKLIKEADKIAVDGHAKSLAAMDDAINPLISAMDNAGWRSSSWGC